MYTKNRYTHGLIIHSCGLKLRAVQHSAVCTHLFADLGSVTRVEDLEHELHSLWSNSLTPGEVLDHCSEQPCTWRDTD